MNVQRISFGMADLSESVKKELENDFKSIPDQYTRYCLSSTHAVQDEFKKDVKKVNDTLPGYIVDRKPDNFFTRGVYIVYKPNEKAPVRTFEKDPCETLARTIYNQLADIAKENADREASESDCKSVFQGVNIVESRFGKNKKSKEVKKQ